MQGGSASGASLAADPDRAFELSANVRSAAGAEAAVRKRNTRREAETPGRMWLITGYVQNRIADGIDGSAGDSISMAPCRPQLRAESRRLFHSSSARASIRPAI